MTFLDRNEAGRILAGMLQRYAAAPRSMVLALPRGGVPVAYQVAQALSLPLDILTVRKLGVPEHEELAMGAIASGGVRAINEDVVQQLHISPRTIDAVADREQRELERREREYRAGKPAPAIAGWTIILVDDGLATGASMRAAVLALRAAGTSRIVVAVPVASERACQDIGKLADEIICAVTPADFGAVGEWYFDFSQVTDEQVRDLLARAAKEHARVPVRN